MYKKMNFRFRVCGPAALATVCLVLALLVSGCGGTCDRIDADRTRFLTRAPATSGTHVEMIVPFAVAERLIAPQVAAVKPIDIQLPNLGKLADYFGNLSVAPDRITLKPAPAEHIGFHLDFDVLRNGRKAFSMYMETEVRPEIDLAAGKIIIGFTPEALQKAKVKVSKDAVDDLGALIYEQIPTAARFLIPRSMVETVSATAVERLEETIYSKLKDKMLPKLSEMSRVEIALPSIPLAAVGITSSIKGGGRLRLAVTTALPVRDGIAEPKAGAKEPSSNLITVRMSGGAAAELVNWAMVKGLLPDRYDEKGKAEPDGELRPGLDWIRGDDRPMKVYLWDLEKPCMRLTMSAKPVIAVVDEKLEIKAENPRTDDVEASAFTKVGVHFYMLWKDPMDMNKKSAAKMKMVTAGRAVEIDLKKASIEQDEIVMEVGLTIGGPVSSGQ